MMVIHCYGIVEEVGYPSSMDLFDPINHKRICVDEDSGFIECGCRLERAFWDRSMAMQETRETHMETTTEVFDAW